METRRFVAVCFVCKSLHTAILPADAAHTPKAWVTCGCGERFVMHKVTRGKGAKKAHKCNASCQHAASFTECNCECGGVNHGARTTYSAGPVHVH